MLTVITNTTITSLQARFVEHLVGTLSQPQPTLCLLSGGSVVALYQQAMLALEKKDLSQLSVSLVDERFGEVEHKDSNWKQIEDTGLFEILKRCGARTFPILDGKGFTATHANWEEWLRATIKQVKRVVAVMGVGPDGHTAGILPFQDTAVFQKTFLDTACLSIAYELDQERVPVLPNPFTNRLTISPRFILTFLDEALVYAVGENKQEALSRLVHKQGFVANTPALLLHHTKSTLFSDQIF